MSNPIITDIYIYPIKSMGGIRLDEARVEIPGLSYDRRWMLVDDSGTFITQREQPTMALFRLALETDQLLITYQDQQLSLPLQPDTVERVAVTIWQDSCEAISYSAQINQWFGNILGQSCRLVYMPPDSKRPVNPEYARQNESVSFADGYPFLLISQASLDQLNEQLEQPVPMNRFRPNIVISGSEPHEEDLWEEFSIKGLRFWGVKACSRCSIVTIDQASAHKSAEPLKTLASYRKKDNKIKFGQNLLTADTGMIRIGDQLEILKRTPKA